MKIYTFNYKSQQHPLQTPTLDPLIAQDAAQHFAHESPLVLAVIDLLVRFKRRYRWIEPSQDYIARAVGCTREWINKVLKYLSSLGVITSFYRHRRSSLYAVTDFLEQPHIRTKLQHLIPALVVFPLHCLIVPDGQFTPINKVFNKNISRIFYTRYISREGTAKKEQLMNKALPTIKGLNLTRYGALRLSVYPDAAIQYAEQELQKNKNLRAPLGFVHSKCKEWCMQHGMKINWSRKYELMEAGETFGEHEAEVQSTPALKDPVPVAVSTPKTPPQREVQTRIPSLHCHPICSRNYASRCIFGYIAAQQAEAEKLKAELAAAGRKQAA
jgi:hypothetical protein